MAPFLVAATLLSTFGWTPHPGRAPSGGAALVLVQEAFPPDAAGRDPAKGAGAEAARPVASPGIRSLNEQGADLRKENGNRNSVRVGMTENRTMRYDVQGRAHNVNGVPIETPHKVVETRVQNTASDGRVYTDVKQGAVEPMNQADMRVARRAVEIQKAPTSTPGPTPVNVVNPAGGNSLGAGGPK